MDDRARESLVVKSALGFIGCASLLLVVTLVFGKSYGRMILLSVIPGYSIYYVVLYNWTCRTYTDEVKRISAFGPMGRGRLVGAIYYLCLWIIVVITLIILIMFFGDSGSN